MMKTSDVYLELSLFQNNLFIAKLLSEQSKFWIQKLNKMQKYWQTLVILNK